MGGDLLWEKAVARLTYACTCTCTCRLFLRLQLRLHLHLHRACTGLHVSAGFHCVCTCVAFVFTPALHLCLQWCCHAASVAMVLHLGCPCIGMLCLIRVSEGDVEESALALAPACCGVSLWLPPAVASLGTASSSCVVLNVLQLHLLALQLLNDCRCLAKQSLRNRNCSRSVDGVLGMVIGLSGLFGFGATPSQLRSVAGWSLD